MICPKCNKRINLIPPAERNLESYHASSGGCVLATSECCGVAFNVKIIINFFYELYTETKTTDDWGNKIKNITNEQTI